MHFYPHHIGDFIRDTSRLSDTQCMAYLRLLWSYYDTESPLPNSPEKLAFQIGAAASDVALILDHFFVLDGDVYKHHRVEKEIVQYRTKAKKASESAKARWDKAKAMRAHSGGNSDAADSYANQEPRTNNQEPSIKEYSADKPLASAKASRSSIDKPDGVDDQTWADFKKLRAAKKSPLTQTALTKIEKQASLAGYTLEQALQTCCERGWQGFDASWVVGKGYAQNGVKVLNKQEALEARNRAIGDEWAAEMMAKMNGGAYACE